MFYIEPNSKIRILKAVPLDTTYNHTLWFATAGAQTSYFLRKTKNYTSSNPNPAKYSLFNQSYTRPSRGWIRVEIPSDDLYDCNYIMFQNTSYGNKWFYAYIDNVVYVNNNVSEIHFVIDVMQTWMFDYTLTYCFVEREHSATDEIGDNIVPEPVNTGLYVCGPGYGSGQFNASTYKILVMATCSLNSVIENMLPAHGQFMAGVYQGVDTAIYEPTAAGIDSLKTFLTTFPLFGNTNNICSIAMLPSSIIPPSVQLDNRDDSIRDSMNRLMRLKFNTDDTTNYYNIPIRRNADNVFNGYTPKNNKLYTYPYNYFIVTNQEGTQLEFQYEQFDPQVGVVFKLLADYSAQPTVICAPYGYKEKRTGSALTAWRERVYNNTAQPNLNYAMYLRGFPRSAWATSDVIAKLVQMTMSTAMIAAGAATANPALAFAGVSASGVGNTMPFPKQPETDEQGTPTYTGKTVTTHNKYQGTDWVIQKEDVAQQIASVIGHNALSIETTGTIGQPNPLYPLSGIDFIFRQVFLDAEYARVIDDYFTMFGYQVNKIKIPNISARPHWNYIKTKDFQLIGSIPAQHAKQICDIYNAGITFWKNGDEVGNYSLDNSPTLTTQATEEVE